MRSDAAARVGLCLGYRGNSRTTAEVLSRVLSTQWLRRGSSRVGRVLLDEGPRALGAALSLGALPLTVGGT